MAKRTMYEVQFDTVNPVEKLLKALVEANAYAVDAQAAGWSIRFDVSVDGTSIDIVICRVANWPTTPSANGDAP